MAKVWMAAIGEGFIPADDDAAKIRRRFEEGECAQFSLVRIRDLKAHRRYWKLMTVCADNCERIEVQDGVWMDVHSKEDVHTAIKMATGHFTTVFDADGVPVFRVPKPTNFEEMDSDEWDQYWPRVLDVVQQRVLPGVDLDELQFEIMKLMGIAGGNR